MVRRAEARVDDRRNDDDANAAIDLVRAARSSRHADFLMATRAAVGVLLLATARLSTTQRTCVCAGLANAEGDGTNCAASAAILGEPWCSPW